MSGPRVCVVGGINMDLHLRSQNGRMAPETSNPSHATFSPGGVGRNVAEALARWNVSTVLLGAVGDDALSQRVLEETAAAGVNVERVLRVPGVGCGLYAALLHASGELAIAAAAMDAVDHLGREYIQDTLDALTGSDLVVVDANLPVEAIAMVIGSADAHGIPVIAEPVSRAKGRRLAEVDGHVLAVTPNEGEAPAFTARETELTADWMVITRGADGVRLMRGTGRTGGYERARDVPGRPVAAVDVTGAGDALVAGFAYGLVRGCDVPRAVGLGMEVARATVLEAGSACTALGADEMRQLYQSACA